LQAEGLESKSSTIQKLGLTRKVYYNRLKQLINAGSIKQSNQVYKYTTLDYFSNHILSIMEHEKYKQIKTIDTLSHIKHITEDELANFLVT
jgi:GTP-sensing pleiotropic transcriptional regulator CodY